MLRMYLLCKFDTEKKTQQKKNNKTTTKQIFLFSFRFLFLQKHIDSTKFYIHQNVEEKLCIQPNSMKSAICVCVFLMLPQERQKMHCA